MNNLKGLLFLLVVFLFSCENKEEVEDLGIASYEADAVRSLTLSKPDAYWDTILHKQQIIAYSKSYDLEIRKYYLTDIDLTFDAVHKHAPKIYFGFSFSRLGQQVKSSPITKSVFRGLRIEDSKLIRMRLLDLEFNDVRDDAIYFNAILGRPGSTKTEKLVYRFAYRSSDGFLTPDEN